MPGIDQQIEQRKMQFGNNPQALQQRYGQSKQLLDLLALQQIATEQQQKAQAMQMQMQQNPATVAQQVEQEVLQGKKAEMAQSLQGMRAMRAPKRGQTETARGVAGALAQKQREQQSRMQKMAGSGVASQPARNMERMYDGGIVGFDKGGAVTDEEIDAAIRENPRLANLPRESVRNIVAKQIARRSAERESVEGLRERAAADPRARRYTRPQPEQVQEERREPKPFSERGVTLEPEETRMAVPGADLPEGLMPASMQRQIEGRRSLEDPELQASLDEFARGFGPQRAKPEVSMESILAAVKGPAGAQPQAPAAVEAQPEPPTRAQLPQNVAAALQGSLDKAGMPAPTAAPAEPSMQEQLIQRLMESSQQEQKDITSAREALEAQYGGRSKGKRILDRLIAASQMQGGARTNQQALARLAGGYATAAGQEEKAREEGLAKLAERQRGLTQGQLGLATGLAGIKRGEEMTELERRRVAELERAGQASTELSQTQLRQNAEQFDRDLAQRAKKNEESLRMRAVELAQSGRLSQAAQRADEQYKNALIRIQDAELELQRTGDPKDYLVALQGFNSSVNAYIRELAKNIMPNDKEGMAELERLRKELIADRTRLVRGMAGAKNVDIPEVMEERGSAATDTEGFSIRSVR